jgi:chitinase
MDRGLSNWIFNIICCAFISIICALSLFFPSSIYAAYTTDVTLAWSSNSEPDLGGYFIYYKTGSSGAPYNGTVAVEGSSPIQVPLSELDNPAYPEYTIHGLSDTETTYFVLTAYDTDGNESGYSNEVSYHPPSVATLSSLSISGNNSVSESSSTSYTATACFSDGSTQTVTNSVDWAEDSPYASINGSGVLTASEVSNHVGVIIQASFTFGQVTKTASKTITIADVPPSNLPPSAPIIMYPETGQDEIDIPLDISTQPFSDPNDDSHGQSQWQISDQSDFSSLVVDATSDTYLTTFSVPHMVLISNQKYYVRVRFYDVYSEASDWSGTVEFTTACFIEDLNSNGISDTEEVDDSVDFNLDGISDIYQPQIIKCVQASDSSNYIGIEKVSSSISEIETLELIDPDTISDTVNRPADLIFGLFSYRLRVNQPGDTAILKIYFSGEIFSSDTIFKYDTINGWYDYSEHTTFNDDGQSVTLEVKDGGYGDSDGLANGIIVDPGGIAPSGGSSYTVTGSSSGGGSGCFIATAAFGSKFEKHVRLLRRFRDLYLMPFKIGRVFVKTYYRYSPPVAEFIVDHDILRVIVRWSLIPLIGLSWMLLHIGLTPTLIFLILISSLSFFYFRKEQRKFSKTTKFLSKKNPESLKPYNG